MAKSRSNAKGRPLPRQRKATAVSREIHWKRWAAVAGGTFAVVLLVYLAQTAGGSGSGSPEVASLARENAGTDVRVLSGSRHTVYHSTASLPTSKEPRADGKPTLVWFSGTWCEYCEQMEPWAHATAAEFSDRLVFVEKSVDHDRDAAARYGVRGTPTFVLIDANGRSMGQFFFQPSKSGFRSAIEQALNRAGVGS